MTNGFVHEALLYNDLDEYMVTAGEFVRGGLEAGEPVMVAVPAPQLEALTTLLGDAASEVHRVDMTELGRNPGRIIPTVRDWVDCQGGSRTRFLSEPIWPGRRDIETVEAVRHEALMNLAFADCEVSVVCPYDARLLTEDVLLDAERTHPLVRCCGSLRERGHDYVDPTLVWSDHHRVVPDPPHSAEAMVITSRLADLRRFVARYALNADMTPDRIENLVLAACEGATNALRHGERPSIARVWKQDGHLVCEIVNAPTPVDPLAGRMPPDTSTPGGRGLWMVNQLCDLVELRSTKSCTSLRMHMSL